MQARESARSKIALAILAAVALACALGSAGIVAWRSRQPRMVPTNAATVFLSALRDADMDALRGSCVPSVATSMTEALCRPRFERVREIYVEVLPRLAQPEWRRVRVKAEAIAAEEWARLRYRIEELGRERLVELTPRDQEALTSEPRMYWAFVVCAGIGALPESDRVKAGDPESFNRGADDDGFVRRAAWDVLDDAERAELGSPQALGREDSPERFAFFDRVAVSVLKEIIARPAPEPLPTGDSRPSLAECRVRWTPPPPASQGPDPAGPARATLDAIAGIARDDVASLAAFVARHGDATATAELQRLAITLSDAKPTCHYLAEEDGSLFLGSLAVVDTQVDCTEVSNVHLDLNLTRETREWTVTAVGPSLLGLLE